MLLMPVKAELSLPPLSAGEYAWNDEQAPATGETIIVVNLARQLLSVYRDGHEIGRSSIIYGADNKPTPIGTFTILQKKARHISNLYGAPMPYMLRLTMDGIAIHGAEVEDGTATHGCIGVPTEFAELLFQAANNGDRVLIAEGRLRRAS
jgi:lipoprotein-anchoring transpeptidase ErfK/SrfK